MTLAVNLRATNIAACRRVVKLAQFNQSIGGGGSASPSAPIFGFLVVLSVERFSHSFSGPVQN